MDSMEINKIVAGLVGALLIYVGINFFTEMAFAPAGGHGDEHHYAYAVEVEEAEEEEVEEVDFAEILAAADAGKGAKVWGKCKACHKLDGTDGTGPHLNGVVGRDIGGVAGFGYSGTLAEMEGDWTPEALDGFLEKPKSYAPGTKMSFAGLKKIEDRANLIAYLESVE